MADIQINELLESTTAANSDWIAIDNGSATKKISVQNFNATGAASAAQSAAAAAQSAIDAAASKTAAEQAEDDAQALITSAQTIVSDAQTYANNASTSAGSASTAANTATAQAAIATNQANLAAGYASNVDTWAKTAKSWAVGGTGTRQGEDTDNSKYYSQQAHSSEINAAASETNAAASEANAATSESNAATSESNAATSETNAATSEGNASASALLASTSETNAAASEAAAALSKTAAQQAENAAETSKEDSEAWAWGKIDGVDVPASHPAYHNNAKYYADQASGGVSGVSSFNARTGNVVPAPGDYAANIVAFDNTGSSLQSTTTQAAIEEVQGNVDALSTVARTGSYADLTNKPTLGTAAAKDSTSSVISGSSDLIESGAVYSSVNTLTTNLNNLNNAAMKTADYDNDSTVKNAGGIKAWVQSLGYITGLAWSALTGKPFSTIGSGLTVSSDVLSADVQSVSLTNYGTASATNPRYQQVVVNGSGATVRGTSYYEYSQTLSTSADTVYTFTNAAITANSAVDVYTNIYGINPSNVSVSSGSCVVTFPKQSTAQSMTCRIYIK